MTRRTDNSDLIKRLEALLVELKSRAQETEDKDLIPIPKSTYRRAVVDTELAQRLGGEKAYAELLALYRNRNPLEVDRELRRKK